MADREARLREKFLNRESAKQIEEEEKSKPEIFQVKPSTDKPKVDIQKICKLQEIKEGFSKFMDKVHTVMFLLAGIFLAANIKRNIVPQFTSFTMLFALLEICLQLYKSIVHKFQFQDLQVSF
ncbi:unnamed protein product [Moneuplotes crassus]|uniref:Uncharacterized protein n=1 Tax=Euplotes crassus TaxID=5936 RepID=A0AAD1XWJ6_EUPCR|nr:unnamed protein product [Moneuplotes crassus]